MRGQKICVVHGQPMRAYADVHYCIILVCMDPRGRYGWTMKGPLVRLYTIRMKTQQAGAELLLASKCCVGTEIMVSLLLHFEILP